MEANPNPMKAFTPLKVGSAVLRDVLKVRQWTCPSSTASHLGTREWIVGSPEG